MTAISQVLRRGATVLAAACFEDLDGGFPLLRIEWSAARQTCIFAREGDVAAAARQRIAELPLLLPVERFRQQNDLSGSQFNRHAGAVGHHCTFSRRAADVNDPLDGRSAGRLLGPAWGPEDVWRTSGLGSMTN
jgi:hypothetical protein